MNAPEELTDEMLEDVCGGASIKEIIAYINTNMEGTPEWSRKKIIKKLETSGKAAAIPMTEKLLENYPDYRDSLLGYLLE